MRDLNRTKLNVNWLCMFFMSMVLKFAEPPILMISTSHANRDVLVLFTGWWRWLNVVATHERPPADEITHGHVSTDWWVKTKTLQPSPLPGTEGSQVAQEEEQQARRACPVVKGVWEGGCMRSFPSMFTFVTEEGSRWCAHTCRFKNWIRILVGLLPLLTPCYESHETRCGWQGIKIQLLTNQSVH